MLYSDTFPKDKGQVHFHFNVHSSFVRVRVRVRVVVLWMQTERPGRR